MCVVCEHGFLNACLCRGTHACRGWCMQCIHTVLWEYMLRPKVAAACLPQLPSALFWVLHWSQSSLIPASLISQHGREASCLYLPCVEITGRHHTPQLLREGWGSQLLLSSFRKSAFFPHWTTCPAPSECFQVFPSLKTETAYAVLHIHLLPSSSSQSSLSNVTQSEDASWSCFFPFPLLLHRLQHY